MARKRANAAHTKEISSVGLSTGQPQLIPIAALSDTTNPEPKSEATPSRRLSPAPEISASSSAEPGSPASVVSNKITVHSKINQSKSEDMSSRTIPPHPPGVAVFLACIVCEQVCLLHNAPTDFAGRLGLRSNDSSNLFPTYCESCNITLRGRAWGPLEPHREIPSHHAQLPGLIGTRLMKSWPLVQALQARYNSAVMDEQREFSIVFRPKDWWRFTLNEIQKTWLFLPQLEGSELERSTVTNSMERDFFGFHM